MTLVRKPIIDKNGHPTTRWVRSDAGAPGTASLPAAPVPHDGSREMAAGTARLFRDYGHTGDYDVESVCAAVERLSPTTLNALGETIDEADGGIGNLLSTLGVWIDYYGGDEPYLRDLIAFRGSFNAYTDRGFIEMAVRALPSYGFLPETDEYSQLDPDTRLALDRILQLTEFTLIDEYDRGEGDMPEIALPEQLAQLIIERPEDFDRITALVVDGVLDGQRAAEMLDSETPAIADGIL